MKFFRSLLFILIFSAASEAVFSQTGSIDFWTNMPNEQLAEELTDRMDDEELLAQILMFGWAGAEPSDLLNSWVTQRGLGSVKVFGWNTDNIQKVAKSVRQLQQEAAERPFKIPLFVATDQEGGWIRHVKGETSDTPGNMAIGASGYPIDAYYSGFYINREIRALGINMNFAPTVDLYSNLDSSVIGPRSFGSEPINAGILGEAFSKGSMDAGVIPTAKHFPGHGDTSLDSHGRLPQIEIDEKTLNNRELIPFKYLIKADIPAIMSGHLSFPQIESDGTPASLSKKMLTEILRGQLKYEGLIITDDMMMNGATLFAGSFARAVTMAIEAGNDIIISSSTANLYDNLWTNNIKYMENNPEFRARVKDAARRVILAKLRYFKSENHAPLYPDENTIYEHIPDKEGQKFFLEQACRSISVYKAGNAMPFTPGENEKVLVAGPFLSLYNEARRCYPNVSTFHFSYELRRDESNFDEWNAARLTQVADGFDTIIIVVYDKHTANIAKRLRYMDKKVIILSIMSPVHILKDFEWADTILCGYSYSNYSFAALLSALKGEFVPKGKIPLD
ncbi:glycoside hydrolase family 3 protein [Treponema sp.]|uniref:glycoside hydrolase family 3 protein n=1 Tax=Treponema sp. TaxID=166 RepID=UPI00298E60F0|nr:glycoside hydrolase family 3 protein [Treponema sp.]MCQ2242192.1 glycoside hydrolase family 3 protein [Treponema sp.]